LLFYYRGLYIQYRLPVYHNVSAGSGIEVAKLGLGIIIGRDGSSTLVPSTTENYTMSQKK